MLVLMKSLHFSLFLILNTVKIKFSTNIIVFYKSFGVDFCITQLKEDPFS